MQMLPILRVFAVFEAYPVDENNPKIVSFEIWDGSHKLDSCSTEAGISGAVEAILRRSVSAVRNNSVGKIITHPPGSDVLGLRDFGQIEGSEAADNKAEVIDLAIKLECVEKRTHKYIVASYAMTFSDLVASITFKSDVETQLYQRVQEWAEQTRRPDWLKRVLELKKKREQEAGSGFRF